MTHKANRKLVAGWIKMAFFNQVMYVKLTFDTLRIPILDLLRKVHKSTLVRRQIGSSMNSPHIN